MILSTHFIAGAAVANNVSSPYVLPVLAVILHFILDVIPHWQYIQTSEELKKREVQLLVFADLLIGPLLIAALVGISDLRKLIWFFIGGFFCMLPDFFAVLALIFPKNKFLKILLDFHEFVQTYSHKRGLIGVLAQLVIVFFALRALM